MKPVTHPNQVGATFQARRKALNLTQTQLAERLGLSQNRLSELETQPATMTVEQLLALANALELELRIGEHSSAKQKVEW
jgi:HTH-type transcriptional regulator/antitoxin HipB